MSSYLKELIAEVKAKNPGEPEFHQAVEEVAESLDEAIDQRVLFNLKQQHFENTLKKAEIKSSV